MLRILKILENVPDAVTRDGYKAKYVWRIDLLLSTVGVEGTGYRPGHGRQWRNDREPVQQTWVNRSDLILISIIFIIYNLKYYWIIIQGVKDRFLGSGLSNRIHDIWYPEIVHYKISPLISRPYYHVIVLGLWWRISPPVTKCLPPSQHWRS